MTEKIPEKGEAEVQEFEEPLDPPTLAMGTAIITAVGTIVTMFLAGLVRIAKTSINKAKQIILNKRDANKAIINPPRKPDDAPKIENDHET